MLPKLVAEFVGTFFLVLTIGLTSLVGTDFAPIAIGTVLTAMVYMAGHVSGAQFNPAVTLAVWLRGGMPARETGPYVVAQVLAAALAALAAFGVTGDVLVVAPAAETSLASFALLEFLFTFALALVILNVATARGMEGSPAYGVAIGFVVLAGAYAAGPISGGAFNPAVAVGPILVDLAVGEGLSVSGLWVYVLATCAGAALAVPVFWMMNPGDRPAR